MCHLVSDFLLCFFAYTTRYLFFWNGAGSVSCILSCVVFSLSRAKWIGLDVSPDLDKEVLLPGGKSKRIHKDQV